MRLRTQRQAVRVTLKELESLSFDITSADVLKNLSDELQALKAKYQQNVTRESGLVLRTQVHATSSFEKARKLKLKYKRLRQRIAPYGSLIPKKQPGRPRSDYRHRNRVGKKASNWRKVWTNATNLNSFYSKTIIIIGTINIYTKYTTKGRPFVQCR